MCVCLCRSHFRSLTLLKRTNLFGGDIYFFVFVFFNNRIHSGKKEKAKNLYILCVSLCPGDSAKKKIIKGNANN